MSFPRYQQSFADEKGNALAGAYVEIRSELTGALAATYSDRAGVTPQSNPSQANAAGFFYAHLEPGEYMVRVYIGASLAPAYEETYRYVNIGYALVPTQREVTAAGDVTISATDADIIVINKTVGAATNVNLPSAADRRRPIMIVDGKADAATNNITIVPESGESIYGTVDYTPVIDGNGGSLKLTSKDDGTGWF